ncbi:MAG: phosphoadenylyl-sulfate reductase [Phototrophicaceae bacterium]
MVNTPFHLTDIPQLQADFEDAAPQDILKFAAQTFGSGLVVVTSFQPTGIVTLHMLRELGLAVDVVTLDTGLLFPETYALMDTLEKQFDLRLKRIQPQQTVQEQAAAYGEALWSRQPDLCCENRKVIPLKTALQGYSAWITGLRRDQAATRTQTATIQWDEKNAMVKLSPFATWTEEMIWIYIQAHELPYNALHDNGYPSIGCWPCTAQVQDGQDIRAGRWASQDKIECGIHIK